MRRFLTAAVMGATLALTGGGALAAELGDDGLHKAPWMHETFKDLREDLEEAGTQGKRLLVIVEQRGCIYCTKMHEEVFPQPEIADLASFLNRMGAVVTGAGSSTITVEGVERLAPVEHTVVADRIEAATYLAAVGIAGGEVTIEGARAEHMGMLVAKPLPYPGVATDYQPFVVAMLCVADGVGIVTENIFGGRFRTIDELARLGADIRAEGHHVVIRGVEALSGAPVRAPDIRAGAALVVAGLAAEGETLVGDAHHVARGYEDLVGRLASLGADIAHA